MFKFDKNGKIQVEQGGINMNTNQAIILFFSLSIFAWLQIAIVTIGNRQYSMHYKSHNLLKRDGVLKLIYFKPKHFHKYSIFEVIDFFASYIILLNGIFFFIFSYFFDVSKFGVIISGIFLGASFLFEIGRIFYIDISRVREEKYMKRTVPNLPDNNITNSKIFQSMLSYSQTIRYELEQHYKKEIESLNDDDSELEKIDEKYIGYFKNYKDLSILNKKIIYKKNNVYQFEISCIFDGSKKKDLPNFNSNMYMPHLVIKGTKEYLGVVFESSDIESFDNYGKAIIRTLYSLNLYENLIDGTEFTIREGNKIVGSGRIIAKL